jgi:hypothetical protein
MNLKLKRTDFTDKSTIGELYVNGKFFCYTIEDKDRNLNNDMDIKDIVRLKQYGITAIPYGTYKVELTMSNRFKRALPLLYKVKGYEGVRLHRGNTAEDSLGCPILGMKKGVNAVYQSTIAENALVKLIDELPMDEEITLEITR